MSFHDDDGDIVSLYARVSLRNVFVAPNSVQLKSQIDSFVSNGGFPSEEADPSVDSYMISQMDPDAIAL